MLGRARILLSISLMLLLPFGSGCAGLDETFPSLGGLPPSPYENVRQVNTRIGVMQLDDKRWDKLDTPTVIGLDYVEDIGVDWLALEGGLSLAYDSTRTQIEGGANAGDHEQESLAFFQFSAGALVAPAPGRNVLRPYAGAGGVVLWSDVNALVDDTLVEDNDNAVGGYAKLGLLVQLSDDTHIGFEVRWLETQSIFAGEESLPLDGMTFSIIFGASYDWFQW